MTFSIPSVQHWPPTQTLVICAFSKLEFIPTDSRGHLVQGWGHQIDFILRFHSLKGSNGFRIYQECVRIAAAVKALEAAPYELIIPSLSLRFRDRALRACGGQNLLHASHQLATSSHRRALQRIAVRRNAASRVNSQYGDTVCCGVQGEEEPANELHMDQ